MSYQQNIAMAQKLLERIGSGRDPDEIAALFDTDLVFEIQGDDGVLPWIGRRTGRQAIADFIRDVRPSQLPSKSMTSSQATVAQPSSVLCRPGSRRPARSSRRNSRSY